MLLNIDWFSLLSKILALSDSTPKKKQKKIDEKCEKAEADSNLSYNSSSSSFSDDDWEDVDDCDFSNNTLSPSTIEVTIKKSKVKMKPVETVASRRARFIKQHINQKLRERQVNCHKVYCSRF